jgi:hypothetical protein
MTMIWMNYVPSPQGTGKGAANAHYMQNAGQA